jgi:hypothetical protein
MKPRASATTPRFTALDAILLLGVGWIIRPLLDAIARHDAVAIAAGVLYLVWVNPRLWRRIPSLPHF